jgi:hypothetical protein
LTSASRLFGKNERATRFKAEPTRASPWRSLNPQGADPPLAFSA